MKLRKNPFPKNLLKEKNKLCCNLQLPEKETGFVPTVTIMMIMNWLMISISILAATPVSVPTVV